MSSNPIYFLIQFESNGKENKIAKKFRSGKCMKTEQCQGKGSSEYLA